MVFVFKGLIYEPTLNVFDSKPYHLFAQKQGSTPYK